MMDARQLLARCQALGLRLSLETGNRIRIQSSAAAPHELVEALRQHKAEVVAMLASEGYRRPMEEAEEIARLVLVEGCVVVWCEALHDTVAFVRSQTVAVPAGMVAYTSEELRQLYGPGQPDPSPQRLRLLHAAKKEGARIVAGTAAAPAGVEGGASTSESPLVTGVTGVTDPSERYQVTADPRPDLAGDSPLWGRLLSLAYHDNGDEPEGLFWALHGLRCCGARLTAADGRVRLEAGELGPEYAELRGRWLVRHAGGLTRLLGSLQSWLASEPAKERTA